MTLHADSKADDYNPNSHNAMFAVIIRRLDDQDHVLGVIRDQTIKTNGRMLAAEAAILECKAGVKDALAKACPGKCVDLEAKVRSLEDSRLGVTWAGKALWAAGGIAASTVGWFLTRKD